MDGTPVGGPIRSAGGVPTWSPAGGWIARTNCNEAVCRTTIMRPDGSDRRELAAWEVPARHEWWELPSPPVWSPDDRVLAMPGPDGSLLVGNGDGSELRAIGTFPKPGGWSADGSTFVFVRDGDAWLAEADGSGVRNLTEFPFGGAAGASWSPDGRWITVAQGFTDVGLLTGWVHPPAPGYGMEGADAAWSPLGTWLALGHGDVSLVPRRRLARGAPGEREAAGVVTRRPAPGGRLGERGGRHEPRRLGPRDRFVRRSATRR